MEELELIENARRGKMEAFGQLIKRYSNAVYAVAFSVTGDFHIAQDIAQETFVKVWRNLDQLKDNKKFRTWVCTIAKRTSVDWLRRKKNGGWEDPITEIVDTESLEEKVNLRERKEKVWEALQQLEGNQREVTILYYISGMNTREISQFLDIPVNTVESHLKRARQKLKRELISLIEETLLANQLGEEFERDVLSKLQGILIYIPAINLEQAAYWYVDYLGYQVTHRGDIFTLERLNLPKIILVKVGSSTHPVQFNRGGDPNIVLSFFHPDIDEIHTFMKRKGANVGEIIDRGVCGRSFEVKDPSGNIIRIDW